MSDVSLDSTSVMAALRPPDWQITNTGLDRSISASRSGSWPIGIDAAPGTWPATYSAGSRTSTT